MLSGVGCIKVNHGFIHTFQPSPYGTVISIHSSLPFGPTFLRENFGIRKKHKLGFYDFRGIHLLFFVDLCACFVFCFGVDSIIGTRILKCCATPSSPSGQISHGFVRQVSCIFFILPMMSFLDSSYGIT